jgi:hypothetical protein
VRDSCGNSESKGDPTGASAPRADRPRKAGAYVPINVQICTSKKTVDFKYEGYFFIQKFIQFGISNKIVLLLTW